MTTITQSDVLTTYRLYNNDNTLEYKQIPKSEENYYINLTLARLNVYGSGGGGGSGDASAANQALEIAELQDINTNTSNINSNHSSQLTELQSIKTNTNNINSNHTSQLTELQSIKTNTNNINSNHTSQLTKLQEIQVDSTNIIILLSYIDGALNDVLNKTTSIDNNLNIQALKYKAIGTSVTANIKSGSTQLYSLSCTNLNASTRYLLLFNSTGSTTTVEESYPIYGNSGFLVLGTDVFTQQGLTFSTGLTFGFSTSATTYVAGSASDCILSVRYI